MVNNIRRSILFHGKVYYTVNWTRSQESEVRGGSKSGCDREEGEGEDQEARGREGGEEEETNKRAIDLLPNKTRENIPKRGREEHSKEERAGEAGM